MPGTGSLEAAMSSSIMVLMPTSSSTDNTKLDAPSSSYQKETKNAKTTVTTKRFANYENRNFLKQFSVASL